MEETGLASLFRIEKFRFPCLIAEGKMLMSGPLPLRLTVTSGVVKVAMAFAVSEVLPVVSPEKIL